MKGTLAALLLAGLTSLSALGGALDRYDLSKPAARFALPRPLREISGLATTDDGRLFGHDDETAALHQIDPRSGRIVKSFGFGKGPTRGDFEGLAIAGKRFFLTTSDGVVLEGAEGEDAVAVPYRKIETGFGATCEIEGLAYEPKGDVLLFACKTPRDDADRSWVTILRFSLASRAPLSPLRIPQRAITRGSSRRRVHPSGLERDPVSGHYVFVASKESALVEVTPEGEVVAVKWLDRGVHPQAEGIAFLPDGTLAIADEGKRGAGTLTLYAPLK
ncbi:MAG TPA: hypothetical protein VGR00_00520 [Thermoanaerobaculia bacterium]|nr:hypothetical protein [Thermoanaerobaculia bacterium]